MIVIIKQQTDVPRRLKIEIAVEYHTLRIYSSHISRSYYIYVFDKSRS